MRRPGSAPPKTQTNETSVKQKPSWDSTNHDLGKYRLSKDDLQTRLKSRQPKPLAEYTGPPNLITKHREDGTPYVIGSRLCKGKEQRTHESHSAESNLEHFRAGAIQHTAAPGSLSSLAKDDQRNGWREPNDVSVATASGAFTFGSQAEKDLAQSSAGRRISARTVASVPATALRGNDDERVESDCSGRAKSRESKSIRTDSAARSAARGLLGLLGGEVSNKEKDLSHLVAACEQLNARMERYETQSNRVQKLEPMPQRQEGTPSAPGVYTEYLLKTVCRIFEHLEESEAASIRLALELQEVKRASHVSHEEIMMLRAELERVNVALSLQIHRTTQAAECTQSHLQHVQAEQVQLAEKVASLSRSYEFQCIDGMLNHVFFGKAQVGDRGVGADTRNHVAENVGRPDLSTSSEEQSFEEAAVNMVDRQAPPSIPPHLSRRLLGMPLSPVPESSQEGTPMRMSLDQRENICRSDGCSSAHARAPLTSLAGPAQLQAVKGSILTKNRRELEASEAVCSNQTRSNGAGHR